MARDVLAIPATGAGVEGEFSISGRVVTKQRNRLSPATIRDLMQYKRWVVNHGRVIALEESTSSNVENDEMDYEAGSDFFDDEDEEEQNGDLTEWIKEWIKKERVSEKIRRAAKR